MSPAADLPLFRELIPPPPPDEVFGRLSRRTNCLWLDSALAHPQLGRYSFLTADPVEFLAVDQPEASAWDWIARRLAACATSPHPDLPPFQGGAAGLFGYELARSLERLPPPRCDEFQTPVLAMGIYDVVVAWDHLQNRAWIVSQGYPETDPAARHRRAAERLEEFVQRIAAPLSGDPQRPAVASSRPPLSPYELAPQFALNGQQLPPGLTSDFSADAYRSAVRRAVEYIRAGDIFQVNLSQRFLYPAGDDAVELYRRLRRRNPATFAAYFDLGEFQIASASPERFLTMRNGQVETRPIKGTRRRMASAEADLFMGDDLRQSEKDRAENVMIVDLLRNDLSRVCRPDSVRVTQLCQLETYEFVLHLVSAVCGELLPGRGPLELIRATFPGGSITGAPKIRAMQIIAELEPTARGPYCGSLGYIGFDGSMDLSILIRTITSGRGWRQLPAGGGIIAPSDPQAEYDETWHKAAGMIKALR